MKEAEAITESLNQLTLSIKHDPELVSLKLKLVEKYIHRMENILSYAKLVILPEQGEKNNMLGTIAQSIAMYQNIPKA